MYPPSSCKAQEGSKCGLSCSSLLIWSVISTNSKKNEVNPIELLGFASTFGSKCFQGIVHLFKITAVTPFIVGF